MQYLLLIHDDESQDNGDLMPEYMAYTEALGASGALVGANQLQPSDTAATVRLMSADSISGSASVTCLTAGLPAHSWTLRVSITPAVVTSITCDPTTARRIEEALEWAAKIPSARFGHIEVRPVVMRQASVSA